MPTFDYYDEQKKYRTTTTITDDGKVTAVNIVFDESIPIINFNLAQRLMTTSMSSQFPIIPPNMRNR